MRKLLAFIVVAALSTASTLRADQGSTAAAFLKLNTSPRAQAMGDAFTGVADDVEALQYNPAGGAFVDQKQVTLMYTTWFVDMSYDYGAVLWPTQKQGTIGLGFFYLSGGTFDGYDANFVPTGAVEHSDETTSTSSTTPSPPPPSRRIVLS